MTDETIKALHRLKLPGMAGCWSSLEETHRLDKLSLRDGMQLMLQHERDTRQANRIARLIRNVGFRLKATIEELETDTTRGIPQQRWPTSQPAVTSGTGGPSSPAVRRARASPTSLVPSASVHADRASKPSTSP